MDPRKPTELHAGPVLLFRECNALRLGARESQAQAAADPRRVSVWPVNCVSRHGLRGFISRSRDVFSRALSLVATSAGSLSRKTQIIRSRCQPPRLTSLHTFTLEKFLRCLIITACRQSD